MFSMTIQQKIICGLLFIAAYIVYLQVTRVEPFENTLTNHPPVSVIQVFDKHSTPKHPKTNIHNNEPTFIPIRRPSHVQTREKDTVDTTNNDVNMIKGEPIRSNSLENYGQQRQRTYQMDTARNLKRFIRP